MYMCVYFLLFYFIYVFYLRQSHHAAPAVHRLLVRGLQVPSAETILYFFVLLCAFSVRRDLLSLVYPYEH